jgi:pimeloyl-ACP methyl ester carboxylesterase
VKPWSLASAAQREAGLDLGVLLLVLQVVVEIEGRPVSLAAEAPAHARRLTVEGAGHMPFSDQPGRFAAAVTPLLEELR